MNHRIFDKSAPTRPMVSPDSLIGIPVMVIPGARDAGRQRTLTITEE